MHRPHRSSPRRPLRTIGRRAALKQTLFAAGSVLLTSACGRGARGFQAAPVQRSFARVRVAPNRVIRTVTGLRPFRPSGFVVRAERADDRTIVHNYGHGGGGITLAWGSSTLAADLATAVGPRRVAVIGCGVMGLTTARLLQDRGFDATIYAKELPPDTTSNVAGGQWSPFTVFDDESATTAFRQQLSARRGCQTGISRTSWATPTVCAGSRTISCATIHRRSSNPTLFATCSSPPKS